MNRRERRLRYENFMEKHGKWAYPAIGFFLAECAILLMDGAYLLILALVAFI